MKFTIASISAALLAVSTVSGASIKRQEAPQDQTASQYPANIDLGSLNGTWYLTGVTQNVWDLYSIAQKTMNIDVNCLQMDVSQTSNTSFDAFGSTLLTHTGTDVGVNATAASAFFLQQPDSSVNLTDSEYLWTAYASQIFVNEAQWKNFTSNGQSQENSTESGSKVVPGSKPVEATIYSKLIDSNAEPGSNTTENVDTIFLWGSKAKFIDDSESQKRAEEVYGIILSKTSSVAEDVFNKTLALMPSQIAENNVTLVLLADSCQANSTSEN
ncbi:hypothetical protein INT47_005701 [Mucor saturninus]|uniref:Lipocalin-like domain-containing protein n=1 Tax=Mucor saturninus TaxID=64648 RepID=A0A8H7QME9_9FUNG|nr:hypothetical protein INT47_005701 [Mucor saturninus]